MLNFNFDYILSYFGLCCLVYKAFLELSHQLRVQHNVDTTLNPLLPLLHTFTHSSHTHVVYCNS